MFSLGYAWNELRRRWGRTLVTAIGLAAGVGLVMGIIGVSQGLSDAQNRVLSPLGSVGTDIIVTRTVAPTTSDTTTTTTTPSFGGGGGFPAGGGGGGGGGSFFGRGVAGASAANSQAAALANANESIITDLAKLGKPGTQFTHDFFVPGTLVTFPSVAITDVAKIPDVTSAVGALSLDALHESGTVPKIVDTVKTGGNTISTTVKPPALTATQTAAERTCIQNIIKKTFNSTTSGAPTGASGSGFPSGRSGTGSGGSGSSGFRTFIGGFGSNPAIEACLTPAQKAYEQKVVVPEQTITRILNPPTTNTATSNYSVAGVDPSNDTTGLITKAQLVSGTWFTSNPSDEVLVYTDYAASKNLKVGGTLTINSKGYKVVGLVSPTLTGNIADVYFPLSTMQSLSSANNYVNEVLVSVKSAADVPAVTAQIKKELPGATVLTNKQLAEATSGSLSNAHKLANTLGGILAIVVLLAAFLIAGLLTLSSVSKRVREIGSLRAIGWTRGQVVRQIMAETVGIGIIGGVIGVGIGAGVCAIVGAVGPGLSITTTGLAVGASTAHVLGQTAQGTLTSVVHLTAPIHGWTILIAFGGALVGGVIAGMIGGWRAARLAPASALRDLG